MSHLDHDAAGHMTSSACKPDSVVEADLNEQSHTVFLLVSSQVVLLIKLWPVEPENRFSSLNCDVWRFLACRDKNVHYFMRKNLLYLESERKTVTPQICVGDPLRQGLDRSKLVVLNMYRSVDTSDDIILEWRDFRGSRGGLCSSAGAPTIINQWLVPFASGC